MYSLQRIALLMVVLVLCNQHVSHTEANEYSFGPQIRSGFTQFDSDDDDDDFHIGRLFESDDSEVNPSGGHREPPHVEKYQETYVDTSDPNNPRHVHVSGESKSIVQPNAVSHYTSKTETAIGQNSYQRSSTTSSSSSSSSFSSSRSSSSTSPNGHSVRTYQTFRNPLTPLILVPKLPLETSEQQNSETNHPYGPENIKTSHNVPVRFPNMPPLSLSTRSKLQKRIGFAQRRLDKRPY